MRQSLILKDLVQFTLSERKLSADNRFEQTNVMFLGVYREVLIVYYSAQQGFTLVNRLENFTSDEVSHMKFIDEHLYLSFPSANDIYRVEFPNLHKTLHSKKNNKLGNQVDTNLLKAFSKKSISKFTFPSKLFFYRRACKLDGNISRPDLSAIQDRGFLECMLKERRNHRP